MCDRGTSSGCFFTSKKGREAAPDIGTSPRRQNNPHANNNVGLRPKEPPSMVIQGDFRKISGISNEIFRQIETIENEYDASTAAALEAVERRGEMIVRILDIKHLGRAAAEAAKKFMNLHDSKHTVLLVEIIKRPGQTLGLYIREGNGLDRHDGVFISRIALESAVYNSGCIKVGDEILAVNLVDVTRMSIDDVVIIMSIPRRLVLATRQMKGYPASGAGSMGMYATLSHSRAPEPKPPPVVILKKNVSRDDDMDGDDDEDRHPLMRNHVIRDVPTAYQEKSRSQCVLDTNGELGTDLYYNSRPEPRHHQTCTPDRRIGGWSYTPQSSILDHPRLQMLEATKNLQSVYDRTYPKTLESLAEKVHPFCPTGSSATLGRRTSDTGLSRYSQSNKKFGIIRTGSDQHLARTEYDDFSRTLPTRQSHTMLRSSLWNSNGAGSVTPTYSRQYSAPSGTSSYTPTMLKRHNVVDYASDTEASYPSIPKSASSSYYYCKPNTAQAISGISSSTLSRLTKSGALSRASSLRSNSLPRDTRVTRNQLSVHTPSALSNALSTTLKYGRESKVIINNRLNHEDNGVFSGPEFPSTERLRRGNFLASTTNIFTSDEYRAWLTRTPSTSAIYDRLKSNRDASTLLRQRGRFTFSAENLPERTRQSEFLTYSKYRPGQLASMGPINTTPLPSATITTLDRHTRTSSLRRLRHLQDLEAKHLGNRSITPDVQIDRSRVLEINTSEFNKYKMEKSHVNDEYPPMSGLLWIHLLAGRGLRVNAITGPVSGSCGRGDTRDLYCVLECDRVHKARTVVRNGDLVFDWDETFELDLFNNRKLDFLVYSWDPQYRHKLCYKGCIHLSSLLYKCPIHQLALKVEPRGTLYLRLRHTNAYHAFLRKPSRPLLPSRSLLTATNLFGTDLDTVVNREYESMSVSMQQLHQLSQSPLATSVPTIVCRCVEEIERRGLDIIGLYRLCGSATKKRILREAFERNPRTIDLSLDNVPDINVITGVFKDYLRELPEPLFTKHLYRMIVDALSVCMSDDPQGNAKLIVSLFDCLSKANRATLIFVVDHLSMVVSQSVTNKMTPQNLSIIFAPLLMIRSESEDKDIDFNQPINILRYLIEVWPSKSVREMITGAGKTSAAHTAPPPPLPKKPSVGSAHVGGPLPIPSKGIRKPPPAVPARFTRAAVVSPITESSSSTCSSTDGTHSPTVGDWSGPRIQTNGVGARKEPSQSNVSMKANMFEGKISAQSSPTRMSPFRSTSYGRKPLCETTEFQDYSNVVVAADEEKNSVVNGDTHLPKSNLPHSVPEEISRRKFADCISNGYSIQGIGGSNNSSSSSLPLATTVDSAKIEEALKEISNSSKSTPASSFGHSRVDVANKQGTIDKVGKTGICPWDNIVESWINETDNGSVDDSDVVTAALTESFRRSHKNPFLSDLHCGDKETVAAACGRDGIQQTDETETADRGKAFSSNFAFCVDSPSFESTSNDSLSSSTADKEKAEDRGNDLTSYGQGELC